jgi:hypothetical protein
VSGVTVPANPRWAAESILGSRGTDRHRSPALTPET